MNTRNTTIGVALGLAAATIYDRIFRDRGSFIYAMNSEESIETVGSALQPFGLKKLFRVNGHNVKRGFLSNGAILNFTEGIKIAEGVMLDDIPCGMAIVSSSPSYDALLFSNMLDGAIVINDFDPDTRPGKMSLVYAPHVAPNMVFVFRRHKMMMGGGKPPAWK